MHRFALNKDERHHLIYGSARLRQNGCLCAIWVVRSRSLRTTAVHTSTHTLLVAVLRFDARVVFSFFYLSGYHTACQGYTAQGPRERDDGAGMVMVGVGS